MSENTKRDETRTTHNYFAHGGNELVIGGKLTFLQGAVIEGADCLVNGAGGTLPYLADSEATTVAALRDDFNALLALMKNAGLMAQSTEP